MKIIEDRKPKLSQSAQTRKTAKYMLGLTVDLTDLSRNTGDADGDLFLNIDGLIGIGGDGSAHTAPAPQPTPRRRGSA